jgi:hypothetical protein
MKKIQTSKQKLRLTSANTMINALSIFTAVNTLQFSAENVLRTCIIWMSVLLSTFMKLKKWECSRKKIKLQIKPSSLSVLMEQAIVTSNTPLHYQNWVTKSYWNCSTNAVLLWRKNLFRKSYSKNQPKLWTVHQATRTLKSNSSKAHWI